MWHNWDAARGYCFSGMLGRQYRWGYRFGGWRALPKGRLLDQAAILAYARELEAWVVVELTALDDADPARPFGIDDGSGATLLGHYVYALRHSMHRHGELAALNVYHGNEGGVWVEAPRRARAVSA